MGTQSIFGTMLQFGAPPAGADRAAEAGGAPNRNGTIKKAGAIEGKLDSRFG